MRKIKKLVLSGGGMKGIAYVGVVRCLEELQKSGSIDLQIDEVCSVSIGSLVGLLYVIGYTYEELYNEIISLDVSNMKKLRIRNFFIKYGLDSGKTMSDWIESLLEKKGFSKNTTLKQLYTRTGINFRVVVTNLNKYNMEIFDYKTNPRLRVIKAIRMSTSIPFVFCAEKYNGSIYIDGGVANNFPISMYDDVLDNVLGCKLMTRGELPDETNRDIDSVESYIFNVMGCFFANKERMTTLAYKYLDYTICIDAYNITHPINFELTTQEKNSLIDLGYQSASEYFAKRIQAEQRRSEQIQAEQIQAEQKRAEQIQAEQIQAEE